MDSPTCRHNFTFKCMYVLQILKHSKGDCVSSCCWCFAFSCCSTDQGRGMFDKVRGGAGNLMKNIKETSTNFISSVYVGLFLCA